MFRFIFALVICVFGAQGVVVGGVVDDYADEILIRFSALEMTLR